MSIDYESGGGDFDARIKVIGIGGGGGNAVNNMIQMQLGGVEFIVANTDAQALQRSLAPNRIQMGVNITRGLGAGAKPEIGQRAAEESHDRIRELLVGADMVFITAGMGGGTGTGAASVVARVARDMGLLTVAIVTKPFEFEGKRRMRVAEEGLRELRQYVDTAIVIPNEKLMRSVGPGTTMLEAFRKADDVLYEAVRGITDLITMEGLINVDFADVRTVMAEMGQAMMGAANAVGEQRALDAVTNAIASPLLEDASIHGARGVLINITGGPDLTLREVNEATMVVRNMVHEEALIVFGAMIDPDMGQGVRVTVVATGIGAATDTAVLPNVGTHPAASVIRPQPKHWLQQQMASATSASRATQNGAGAQNVEEMASTAERSASQVGRAGRWRTKGTDLEKKFGSAENGLVDLDKPTFLRLQMD
ncbi:MAG: cell division protein FtsZ [Magnetococcales bacterium]|nr:cell division protein FtsZ [Magnetococcales bacterium]